MERKDFKHHVRKEGWEKASGQTLYIDDLPTPAGTLFGVTARSKVSRGTIKDIRFLPGIPWDEFVIVTAKDIPGHNYVMLLTNDQPFLADKVINHPEEPVVLLAHPDKYLAIKALDYVDIVCDEQPGVYSIAESVAKKHIIWGEDNVFKKYLVEKGDVDQAFRDAEIIVEGEYETGAQEQLYIETNGMLATYDPATGITVTGSLQCPYYVLKALKPLFNEKDDNRIRVVQAETGGGFGGKEEYPSMIAGHAALLAYKSRKPVKMIYDRTEDMVATTKRHPSWTRHRTALTRDGSILAMDIEFILDGGAYNTLSPVVLSRGTLHAAGPYEVPHVRIKSAAVATNTPPHGAFRGFGAPQSVFAIEKHMEKVAQELGMDSLTLRRKNFIPTGGIMATGQIKKDPVSMNELVDKALELTDYQRKRELFAKQNRGRRIKKGIGLATFMHGAGFTGSGERDLKSVAAVEGRADGKVYVLAASTEIGQGKNTIFAQVAAETLGLEMDQVEIQQPDTTKVPNSGPTVASRTVMVVGKLVERSCISLRETLQKAGCLAPKYTPAEFSKAIQTYLQKHGALKSSAQYEPPSDVYWDNDTYKGDAYATYAWAVYVAEVSVDLDTYETVVDDFVALQEVGRVMNPKLAEGQIEGGVAQGIGYAIYEKVRWQKGRMTNGRFTNYIMPTSADIGNIRVFFEELPSQHGPGGAKGIGELPLDGSAPAVINALEHALGVHIPFIPALPEDVRQALKEQTHG